MTVELFTSFIVKFEYKLSNKSDAARTTNPGKRNHQCVKCDSHEDKTRITERMWEALCGKRIKQPVALAVLFVLMFIGGCFL